MPPRKTVKREEVAEVETIESNAEEVAVVTTDEIGEIHTLSTGVRVRFDGDIPAEIIKSTFTSLFVETNLNSDGTINEQGQDVNDQLKLTQKMGNYNSSLLSQEAVTLVDGLPSDERWLRRLRRDPVITEENPYINFNDKYDQEFLYLRYIAFASDEDWALLSAQLINL